MDHIQLMSYHNILIYATHSYVLYIWYHYLPPESGVEVYTLFVKYNMQHTFGFSPNEASEKNNVHLSGHIRLIVITGFNII